MKKIIILLTVFILSVLPADIFAEQSRAISPAHENEILLSAINNPFGLIPADIQSVSYFVDNTITITQTVFSDNIVLTTYTITGIDSLETITPSFASGNYFAAALYNNLRPLDSGSTTPDSTVIGVTVDGSNDSARVILLGAYDASVTGAALDTLPTNKVTFIQRGLNVREAGKYVYPFWAIQVEGIQIANGTVRVYFLNIKRR